MMMIRLTPFQFHTRVPGHGVVCVILSLAILTQYQRMTDKQYKHIHIHRDRQTHDDSIYCASIALHGKNEMDFSMQTIMTRRLSNATI